ncbi:alpha/beta fold hydrolase [Herbiconiux sp. SYSU D00978]|uniref:alpha/beta fold hydrolase n=1 Tax=Herbiconiux sp. SYSU D00978 TaxID=2812562 RepID=UPI001A9758C9|nr:alpha/beta fold hydrolase [Herbiconiux sp. SYSU D00978]
MSRFLPTPPTDRWGRALAAMGVAATGVAAGALVAGRSGLAGYLKGARTLGSSWSTVPGIAGAAPLRVHARFSARRDSDQPSLVLVPGYAIGGSYLMPLAGTLAGSAPVYVVDLPGHGESDHDARPLAIPELAEALAAWLTANGLLHVVLVAHSNGCQIAAEVSQRHPDLVAGLVLIGPTSDPTARTPRRQLFRGALASLLDRPSYLFWGAVDYPRAGRPVLRKELRDMVGHRIEDVLPALTIPVRVIRGGLDLLVPRDWAAAVAAAAGAPPPVDVGWWGHAVHYDSAPRVADAVLELASTALTTPPRQPAVARVDA